MAVPTGGCHHPEAAARSSLLVHPYRPSAWCKRGRTGSATNRQRINLPVVSTSYPFMDFFTTSAKAAAKAYQLSGSQTFVFCRERYSSAKYVTKGSVLGIAVRPFVHIRSWPTNC